MLPYGGGGGATLRILTDGKIKCQKCYPQASKGCQNHVGCLWVRNILTMVFIPSIVRIALGGANASCQNFHPQASAGCQNPVGNCPPPQGNILIGA